MPQLVFMRKTTRLKQFRCAFYHTPRIFKRQGLKVWFLPCFFLMSTKSRVTNLTLALRNSILCPETQHFCLNPTTKLHIPMFQHSFPYFWTCLSGQNLIRHLHKCYPSKSFAKQPCTPWGISFITLLSVSFSTRQNAMKWSDHMLVLATKARRRCSIGF